MFLDSSYWSLTVPILLLKVWVHSIYVPLYLFLVDWFEKYKQKWFLSDQWWTLRKIDKIKNTWLWVWTCLFWVVVLHVLWLLNSVKDRMSGYIQMKRGKRSEEEKEFASVWKVDSGEIRKRPSFASFCSMSSIFVTVDFFSDECVSRLMSWLEGEDTFVSFCVGVVPVEDDVDFLEDDVLLLSVLSVSFWMWSTKNGIVQSKVDVHREFNKLFFFETLFSLLHTFVLCLLWLLHLFICHCLCYVLWCIFRLFQ